MENKEVKAGDHMPAIKEVAVFSDFDKQLAKLKKESKSLVFDITTKDGEKQCRSHIHAIRGIKGSLREAKKDEKADVLARGRAIEDEYKRINAELDDMIETHKKPLDEALEKEESRKTAHRVVLNRLRELTELPATPGATFSSVAIDMYLGELAEIDTAGLEEFKDECDRLAGVALQVLTEFRDHLAKQEADARELDELRKKNEAREAQDREEAIRKEEQEKAEALILEAQNKVQAKFDQLDEELHPDAIKMTLGDIEIRLNSMVEHLQPDPIWPYYGPMNMHWVTINDKLIAAKVEAMELEEAQEKAREAKDKADKEQREAQQKADQEKHIEEIKIQAEKDAEHKQKEKEALESRLRNKREADEKHKKKIDDEAVKSLLSAVNFDDHANLGRRVIEAISEGEVKHMKVEY